ncbi:hypothetical protein MML48_2g00001847 [Holotrichia oblita]|uniref:Uncharacterized protein n=1 Tax=Holotrichia oblita TaxID=644536 RepID=A0ACB9TMM8_HOLOL|nr:hypothetical protein MML48_2g00001847 [Holotrichia oblita]
MAAEGFVKASTNNLPSVDMFMVMDYIKRDECFNSAEIRGAKAAMVSRQEYGDSAIGYVEVKREGPQCIVQCKICPEHRIRSKNYVVCLTVDEANESIVSVECKDCAAAAGGCKHALAFLMWMHRRTEEPSPTEVTSYWKKPRLSSVGTSLKFITASGFIKKTVNPPICDISSFRNELTSVGESSNLTGHLIKYASATYEDAFEKLSLYKLMLRFRNIGGIECGEFIKFAATQMNNSLCTEAEKRTRAQSIAPLWHELRYGRITASKLFEIAHCKTPEGTLVESIIGAYKVRDTKFMKRGRLLEKKVLRCVEQQLQCKVNECGFFTMPLFPVLGASPDGISKDHVIEIKCPSSVKNINSYIKDNNITAKFKGQLHLQMICAHKKKVYFVLHLQTSKIQIMCKSWKLILTSSLQMSLLLPP